MDTLLVTCLHDNEMNPRFIGWINVHGMDIKLVDKKTIEEIVDWLRVRGFKRYETKMPRCKLHHAIKVKEW